MDDFSKYSKYLYQPSNPDPRDLYILNPAVKKSELVELSNKKPIFKSEIVVQIRNDYILQTSEQVLSETTNTTSSSLHSSDSTSQYSKYDADDSCSVDLHSYGIHCETPSSVNTPTESPQPTTDESTLNASTPNSIILEIFSTVNTDKTGRISQSQAEAVLELLNSRLGRSYSTDDALSFFKALDANKDGYIDYEEFKDAFLSIL
jgi:hypothetical protein